MSYGHFVNVHIPDSSTIIELILYLRGLECALGCKRPLDHRPEHWREVDENSYKKYCQTLIRFKHFRTHKGYQRALSTIMEYYPCIRPEIVSQYKDTLRTMTRQFAAKKRWKVRRFVQSGFRPRATGGRFAQNKRN